MRLLVSVRDADEATTALAGGADVIDVKDPGEGALGAPAPQVLAEVARVVAGRAPVSVALGDLPDLPHSAALAACGAVAAGATMVKVGLRSIASLDRAVAVMSAVRAALPAGCAVIAAGYADAGSLSPPGFPPARLAELVGAAGLSGALIDTAVKDGAGLYAHLGTAEVAGLVTGVRAAGGTFAVAGQLTVAQLRSVDADLVGVRSAVCVGGDRSASLSAPLVAAAVAEVHGPPAA